MKIIAIIGFGFCGRLSFYHLANKVDKNTKIIVFEKNGLNTLGPAFSSFSSSYILNVQSNKMSAFSKKPYDFCEFLQKDYPQIWQEVGEDGFAPRETYGKYINKFSQEAFKNFPQVEFISEEVVKISKEFLVETKSSRSFKATEIILATSFNQKELPINFASKNLIKNLWHSDSLEFHQKNFDRKTICLVGSGLTAVDLIVSLKKKNFNGKIIVISRHGNFPKKHFSTNQSNPNFISIDDAKKGVVFLSLKIRHFLQNNPEYDLRHVVDSIRHNTSEIWQAFDERNKKLFLRFLLPYWNIFRHRAPINSIELIESMIASGQLEIKKKGLKNLLQQDEKILAQTPEETVTCDYLINCLGFEFCSEKYPLLQQMLNENLLKKDLLLVKSNHSKIHLLGGLNIGQNFECSAVPDLRVSVENIFL